MISTLAGHGSPVNTGSHRKQRTHDDERESLLQRVHRDQVLNSHPRIRSEVPELSFAGPVLLDILLFPGVRESHSFLGYYTP